MPLLARSPPFGELGVPFMLPTVTRLSIWEITINRNMVNIATGRDFPR